MVTALFVDVVGSSALTVEFGAERLKRVLDRAFVQLRAIISAEGGTVEKFVGDAIHALFGAPVAHPDDPERALRAASACLDWAATQAGAPVPLDVRIGIETGEAIVDLAAVDGDRQQMSVGPCINVAARLQQLAQPGQAVVGYACRQAVADGAEFVPLGEVELKGLGRHSAWRLAGPVQGGRRTRLPFVGRQLELDLLDTAYRRAATGRSVLVLVVGVPGQGKTRLVEHFVDAIRPRARVLRARCRPPGEPGAGTPLRELVGEDATALSADALDRHLAELVGDPAERRRVFAALAHSTGLAASVDLATLGAAERRDELANGWRRYLAALARAQPVVAWVDDLHWADAETVALVDQLTLATPLPLLVIATARPELVERVGLRSGGHRIFVELDGLDATEARALARHAAGRDAVGVERAEGNPLFVIELARSRASGEAAALPLTLQGLIGARLDELPVGDRELLQQVAVVGERVSAAEAALLSGRDPAEVTASLERLADRLVLLGRPGAYRFHHALVREVAYGRLPTAERLRLHAHYAEQAVGADDVETRAHHLWEAVGGPDTDWVWEEPDVLRALRARAYEAQLAAGRHAQERLIPRAARERYERALRLAPDPAARAAVEQALGEAQAADGDGDEAWARYMSALELFRAQGAPPADLYADLVELAVWTPGMFHRLPDIGLVGALLAEGESLARRVGPPSALARLLAARAHFAPPGGEEPGLGPIEEGLRLLESTDDVRPFARFLVQAAGYQVRWGHVRAAQRTFRHVETLAATGYSVDQVDEYRVALALHMGDLELADRVLDRFARENTSRGPHLRTHSHRERAHLLFARGDWPGLLSVAGEAERLVAEHPGTAFCYAVTTTRALGAVAHAMLDEPAEAARWLARAEPRLTALPFSHEEGLLLAYGVLGRRDEAGRLLGEARARSARLPLFFRRTEAAVLTMLERWGELSDCLSALDGAGQDGGTALAAMAAAIREEMAAAHGGRPPSHAALRALGYAGWSAILSLRPARPG